MNWKKYIQQLLNDGYESLSNILNSSVPYIKYENQIYFEIYEKSHFTVVTNFKNEIENYLKKSLENEQLTLNFIPIYEDANIDKKNIREIFDEIAKKNTNLLYLKQIFNLDID